MKKLVLLCAALALLPDAHAVPTVSFLPPGVMPAVSGYCHVLEAKTQTATTTATALVGSSTWTTVVNPSTSTDLLCAPCSGFNATYATSIGVTATAMLNQGIGNIQGTANQVCCKVSSGTLVFGYYLGKTCP